MPQTLAKSESTTAPQETISAAKMHVLDLEPIKERLGARWPRMSLLVHKLVSTALKKAQGPNDHFKALGELAYIATFDALSQDQADAALADIIEKVCEKLFGVGVPQISVRSVTGTVPQKLATESAFATEAISTLLEKEGRKTIVSIPRDAPLPKAPARSLSWAIPPQEGWIRHGLALGEEIGITFRYAPVWELQTAKSRLLALTMNGHLNGRRGLAKLLAPDLPYQIVDVEIALLFMTASFADRLSEQGQIASLMVGVSYDTMARRETRLRYLRALKELNVPISCPILLRIERIPNGAVAARIAQLSAMLAAPNVRVILNFQNVRTLPPFDFRLGVAGIGTVLPPHCDFQLAARFAQEILRRASDQKCLSFLDGLDSARQVLMAEELGIKFATGQALDRTPEFTGLEEAPHFPLYSQSALLSPPEED